MECSHDVERAPRSVRGAGRRQSVHGIWISRFEKIETNSLVSIRYRETPAGTVSSIPSIQFFSTWKSTRRGPTRREGQRRRCGRQGSLPWHTAAAAFPSSQNREETGSEKKRSIDTKTETMAPNHDYDDVESDAESSEEEEVIVKKRRQKKWKVRLLSPRRPIERSVDRRIRKTDIFDASRFFPNGFPDLALANAVPCVYLCFRRPSLFLPKRIPTSRSAP